MKIAAIQHDIVWEDGPATRAHVAPLIKAAADGGAQLIALTEMYATGFSMDPARVAEPEDGPNEQFLRDQAAANGVWMVASIAQTREVGRPRNVAVVAGPRGQLHRYAKIHPFSYAHEDEQYDAGTELITIDVDGLAMTPLVCYDLRFADCFWAVGERTDLFVVVANWPETRRDHWRALLRARAIENQAYVLGVNRVGRAGRLNHAGDSAVLDPAGRPLAEASGAEAVLLAEADPATVRAQRAEFPFLADRGQTWQVRAVDHSTS
jgi:predicted amidohydrolase